MKDLGREARALLNDAAYVDAAPRAIRRRGRERLVAALAAGGVTTSAIVAKGAAIGVSGTAHVGSSGALTTLVSAVVVGMATGLLALSPTSQRSQPAVLPSAMPSVQLLNVGAVAATSHPVRPATISATAAEARDAQAVAPGASVDAPLPRRLATTRLALQPEAPNRTLPDAPAPADAIAAPPTTKASIARETELLHEVQRALKGGRALLALSTLDRYAEECPARMLNEEATASRIVAVCALGRSAEGQRLTEDFVRRYPESPLLPRVRGACPAPPRAASSDAPSRSSH